MPWRREPSTQVFDANIWCEINTKGVLGRRVILTGFLPQDSAQICSPDFVLQEFFMLVEASESRTKARIKVFHNARKVVYCQVEDLMEVTSSSKGAVRTKSILPIEQCSAD